MTDKPKSKKLAKITGGVLLVAGLVAVFVIDRDGKIPDEPDQVRPLKTMVIESSSILAEDEHPGRVLAGQRVDLAFEVAGILQEFPVRSGDSVTKGSVLARLDPRDYDNNLKAAQAELQRAQAHLERIKKAAALKAVSQQELSDAEAAFRSAQAQVNITTKAVEDTVLRARFDGIVANTFVENFENVQAKEAILSLQDIKEVDIEVFVPESRVARADREKFGTGELDVDLFVVFSVRPGEEYPATLKEWSAEADLLTQTYRGVVTLTPPSDLNILPGMTATVLVKPKPGTQTAQTAFDVPLDAVPVDGQGQYFVWLVNESAAGQWTVKRQDVEVGPLSGPNILVTGGLSKGDRIALAGVNVLREGQQVRLLGPSRNSESTR